MDIISYSQTSTHGDMSPGFLNFETSERKILLEIISKELEWNWKAISLVRMYMKLWHSSLHKLTKAIINIWTNSSKAKDSIMTKRGLY